MPEKNNAKAFPTAKVTPDFKNFDATSGYVDFSSHHGAAVRDGRPKVTKPSASFPTYTYVSPLDRVCRTTKLFVYDRHAFVVSTPHAVQTVPPVGVSNNAGEHFKRVGCENLLQLTWPVDNACASPRCRQVDLSVSRAKPQNVFVVPIHL